MSKEKVLLKLKNDLSEINTLCGNLEQLGEELGLSQKTVFEICLAMEELVTNIISYGYTDDAVHWIKLAISHEHKNIIVRLEDDGIPFNPLMASEPDCDCPIEQRKVGKLGIHLTKKYMDDMNYERCGDKNILTLKKNLKEI